jgi:predicted ATPase
MYMRACLPIIDRMPRTVASGLAASLLRQADAEAFVAVPREHRAADDARRLWFTWNRMNELVAGSLDGWPG